MREGDMDAFVPGEPGEGFRDARMLVPVEERPDLADRAGRTGCGPAAAGSGVSRDGKRVVSDPGRRKAVLADVKGRPFDPEAESLGEDVAERGAVLVLGDFTFCDHVDDPARRADTRFGGQALAPLRACSPDLIRAHASASATACATS